MKNIILKSLCCIAVGAMALGCNGGKKAEQKKAEQEAIEKARLDSIKAADEKKQKAVAEIMATLPEEPVFDIVTNMGTIKVKLYSKTPKHRENFERLALSGYYNGLLFHRVINGFMIQGGDPNTKDAKLVDKYGQGGPGYTIPAEFVPEYTHKKGALAAARRGDAANPNKESSGSQFYIVQDADKCAQLDGGYTVFGEVVEGLDVVDKIASVKTNQRDLPESPVKITTIKLDDRKTPSEK